MSTQARKQGLTLLSNALTFLLDQSQNRKQQKLRQECQELKDKLDDQIFITEHSELTGMLTQEFTERLMALFNSAVDTRKSNIISEVLDTMTKIVARNMVLGVVDKLQGTQKEDSSQQVNEDLNYNGVEPIQFKELPVHAQLLYIFCRSDVVVDDGVEVRVLRGLLTAVTSQSLVLHGEALTWAVRTCFNIFITSRNDNNQTTAKASLTQMLTVVFQRMEAASVYIQVTPIAVSDMLGISGSSQTTNYAQTFLNGVLEQTFGLTKDKITANIDGAFDAKYSIEEQGQMDKEKINPTPKPQPSSPSAESQQEAEGEVEDKEKGEEEGEDTQHKQQEQKQQQEEESGFLEEQNVLMKDAYLVFRALCRISFQSSESAVADAATIRGRVLALELLKVLLENSGEAFRNSEQLTYLIKNHLNLSLLKNSTSNMSQILQLSCSILLTLLSKFRSSLKAEIGVFFPMILLKAIEPPPGGQQANKEGLSKEVTNQDYDYKRVVIRCLQELCKDGQILVDLFVNYDCDLDSRVNIFERMVNGLVSISQQVSDIEGVVTNQERTLYQDSAQCLSQIMESIYSFYKEAIREQGEGQGKVRQYSEGQEVDVEGAGEGDLESPVLGTKKLSFGAIEGEGGEGVDYDGQRVVKKKLLEGVNLFNLKPKKGIKLLQDEGLVGKEPLEVAKFLAMNEDLDKELIGEYLGEREEFNIKVMHEYVDRIEFGNLGIDEAIRKFLSGFRLPGEGQKIDRLMEKFAERYYNCNLQDKVFRNADAAYVLSYSIIMLNTDLHNPQNKRKMTLEQFVRNNRGINGGEDLPFDFLEKIYSRIENNEIKMRDESLLNGGSQNNKNQIMGKSVLFETLISLLPNRKQLVNEEPSEDAINRTLEYLKEKAKGAQFFISRDPDTVRPMFELSWKPVSTVLARLLEKSESDNVSQFCLNGMLALTCLAAVLEKGDLRISFINSLAKFTSLNQPLIMATKNSLAFQTLLRITHEVGDSMEESWATILRCISKFEYLWQLSSGAPSDALLFASADVSLRRDSVVSATERLKQRLKIRKKTVTEPITTRSSGMDSVSEGMVTGGPTKLEDVPPQPGVLEVVDQQEINRLFVGSSQLDADAIVEFVKALCDVATEELKSINAPRVFSLTKIVEIAHFNMSRIRLVWTRIWNVLTDFFVDVGCHSNLQIAMYAVDSLRQLSMKFLERDELSNYTFQNDFLRPFTIIMRKAKVMEIRELIIRCTSQMVLARVANVKSGWKSMFMVFSQAANDKNQTIVYLAFETVERIVRDHFRYITETETAVFTDCVNCLTAFANNNHNIDVALNAIAFLRYCALKLAEGAIGDVEEKLPEGTLSPDLSLKVTRIISHDEGLAHRMDVQVASEDGLSKPAAVASGRQSSSGIGSESRSFRFTDKDEHVYYWFPLLTGLSELTFDPRSQIRYGALEVLFDTLKYHGTLFSQSFWVRVLDSVLLPIFDYVRAEVTDTITTDESKKAEVNTWLYETCTHCLQHLVDLYVYFHNTMYKQVHKMLKLLSDFIVRPHQSLASVGVAAFARYIVNAGGQMSESIWVQVIDSLQEVTTLVNPDLLELVTPPPRLADASISAGGQPLLRLGYSLNEGVGARRLQEVRCHLSAQILLVQVCGEVYCTHAKNMSSKVLGKLLDIPASVFKHANGVDSNFDLRVKVQGQQAEDGVQEERLVPDPPLQKLEIEGAQVYMSMLLHLYTQQDYQNLAQQCQVEDRLTQLCLQCVKRFMQMENDLRKKGYAGQKDGTTVVQTTGTGKPLMLTSIQQEFVNYSPLMSASIKGLGKLQQQALKSNLKEFFPMLTQLITAQYIPQDVLVSISELFINQIAPLIGGTSLWKQ